MSPPHAPHDHPPASFAQRAVAAARPRAELLTALGVGLLSVFAAWTAMLPGIWFWDTAEAQIVGPTLGVMHPTGFPAYVLLGWLASVVLTPFGEPAFRMNLLSGLLIAAAAMATLGIVRRLGAPLVVAAAAGIGFALTPVAWRMSTHADVHALHVALAGLVLLLLVAWEQAVERDRDAGGDGRAADRWLLGAAAAYGVSLANHQLTLLLAPAIALFVLAVLPDVLRRPRLLAAGLLLPLAVAALLYLELPLRAGPFRAPLVYGHPETLEGLAYILLAEQFRSALLDPFADPLGTFAATFGRLDGEFGPLLAVLPVAFVVTAIRRPRYALLTGVASVTTLVFNAAYQNADIGRYDLGPVLMAWTWLGLLAGVVVEAIVDRLYGVSDVADETHDLDAADRLDLRERALTGIGLFVAAVLLLPTLTDLGRRHATIDRSSDRSAQVWMERAFAVIEPDAVVLSWWSYSTPLWYGQLIEGRRPDIRVIDDRTLLDESLGEVTDVIDAHLGRVPVYVMRAFPDELAEVQARFTLELVPDTDVLYRVTGRTGAAG